MAPFLLALLVAFPVSLRADWPMLRGDAAHSGFVEAALEFPLHREWAVEFPGERIGTAVEPIISGGQLFIGTHQGNVYAIDSGTGHALWAFHAQGPILHSPCVARDLVVVGSADGHLYGLAASTGRLVWSLFFEHGFAAAPIFHGGLAFVGSRGGKMAAIDPGKGAVRWQENFGVPIRQTAAVFRGKVYVTGEDLHLRCLRESDGQILWTSPQFSGQTARDYYPVAFSRGGKNYVVVRTNPIRNMAQQISRDRNLLSRQAGIDDSNWKKIDAWIKSDAAHGTSEVWANEQAKVIETLQSDKEARTFFVLDADSGEAQAPAPVLWIGGCQGIGAEPAATRDGQLLVFYRSAYGNWNHGVAPLVALGLWDPAPNRVHPLFHQQGAQPRWNCFWGTADESQNFLVARDTALIIHQGTLSGFNLEKNELFPIAGERDTFGGLTNPPWARNEWHGPARAGVAVTDGRVYWQTGSRILCLASGKEPQSASAPFPISFSSVPHLAAPSLSSVDAPRSRSRLEETVAEWQRAEWAPLFVEPGLAGRDFSFDNSSAAFEALSLAWPALSAASRVQVREQLRQLWRSHSPLATNSWFDLKAGARREWFAVPPELCARAGIDRLPHLFGNLAAVWHWAERCQERELVLEQWDRIKDLFRAFQAANWRLDPAKGDLHANRYYASLRALNEIARLRADKETAEKAARKAEETADALVSWWQRAADTGTLGAFKTSAQLDPFIGKGDRLSFSVAPHRHKIALFKDLSPELAALLKERAAAAVEKVWNDFNALHATWFLAGEERQVHYGENYIDPPDLAEGAFRALAFLRDAPPEELARHLDKPFCKADLYYIEKLGITLARPK